MNKIYILYLLLISFLFSSCRQESAKDIPTKQIEFGQPVKVEMIGYTGNIMEPFLSRDGSILFFNNLNAAPENTNLHWAKRINDSTFQYQGEISGVNTPALEGVPSLDDSGNLFFVSTRDYANTLSTIYHCRFANGVATDVGIVNGVSKKQPGIVNFDVETSADGQTLYFVDGNFDQSGNPDISDFVIAKKNGSSFQRISNSVDIFKNINTSDLEYAACISVNQLEFYFTRVAIPLNASSFPQIFVSTRTGINEPFGIPTKIKSITGFAEAATIAPDQKTIYYHKKENGKFVLYLVRKK